MNAGLVVLFCALGMLCNDIFVMNANVYGYSPSFSSLHRAPHAKPHRNLSSVAIIIPTPNDSENLRFVRATYDMMMMHPFLCTLDNITTTCKLATTLRFVVGRGGTAADNVLVVDAPDMDPDGTKIAIEKSSTTIKVLKGIQWAAKQNTDYVLRQDVDAHVNLLQLAYKLNETLMERWLMGRFFYDGMVKENWLRHYLKLDVYPPYPSGMGFVMTADIAKHVAGIEHPLLSYPEDTIFGLWIAGLRVIREDSPRFHNIHSRRLAASCRRTDILTHYMTPQNGTKYTQPNFTSVLMCIVYKRLEVNDPPAVPEH